MELISEINGKLNDIVWGPVMLALLIWMGLFLSSETKFLQFRKFGYMLKNTILGVFSSNQHEKDASGVSPFQAVATAMAGTIGTGSIAGIATAIVSGGPGAIFWMWVSALLGMVTKYAEIVLSLHFREKNSKGEWIGGPMYYIRNGLKIKWLAALFAIFAMFACMGTGNATQSNSIAIALESTFDIAPWITGVILTAIAAGVILGGMRRIASVNEKLVPLMAVFYVVCSVVALILNIDKVPAAFSLILKEAFNLRAAGGGVAGYGIMTAMHYGFSRGVFSNEAGLGSAPIAHAASSTKDPVKQGLWGMFEVFFTTIVICTLSGIIVLSSGLWNTGEYQGSALSIAAFNSAIPTLGGIGVTLATIFFALSTILGWAYYGEVCIQYLVKKSEKAIFIYRCFYVAVVFIGAVGNLDLIWSISETMNGLMIIPNMIGVIGLYRVVTRLTKEHFEK
ncbi:MAG: sodium:alanine symporter family protein [Clostridia bacterium]|nr:sodium:alanine symporter family protein [Clostridia bacterium]MBQ6938099.1 sodium:alanine symporter family protein [Clostridia bacterium]